MIKKNKSRNQIVTGIVLGAIVLIIAIFGRVAGENFSADVDLDLDICLDVTAADYDIEICAGSGSGSNSQPGCGSSNCLTAPDAGDYSGIAVEASLRQFLITWTNFFLQFLALIAMIALIYAGFLYVTAAGNDEQAGKAKKIIGWVVIGIIVILLAYALVNTLITTGPTGSDL